jgi:methylglutaconyl-CoA hydratase
VIETSIEKGIGLIALARPELRNALNAEVMRALSVTLDAMAGNADVRVVVITGRGKAFSAGADLAFMRKMAESGTAANRADALEMGRLFHRVATLPKPVIARVGGPAIGGGVGLLAACDVVIAADTAFFQFSEVRLGLIPAVISPFCIRRLGAATAKRLFLTAERISAADAQRHGLVDEVVAADGLDVRVGEVCRQMLAGGPAALAAAKTLVDTVASLAPEDALEYTANRIADLRASAEAREGMQAFLEKRPAQWTRGSDSTD